MSFQLPALPYAHDALEPYLSAETLRFHHGKHHAAYVDKLNSLTAGTSLAGRSLEEVIAATAVRPEKAAIFNNAAQAWNHAFYWQCMKPNGGGQPGGDLAAKIVENFHGFENFRGQFISAAVNQFGSGWVWLVVESGKLQIKATSNAGTPMTKGQHALLTCDVWEHAYYVDYRNRRPDYAEMFLEKLVNWDFAAKNMKG